MFHLMMQFHVVLQMISNLQFCTSQTLGKCSVFGILNLGDFYVTVTTYQNLICWFGSLYTTNNNESINWLLKEKVCFKKQEWPEFNTKMFELVSEQHEEF